MAHRVADRRSGPDDADLTDALAAHRVEVLVVLVDPVCLYGGNVGVRRYVVGGQVALREVAERGVEVAVFGQRHAQPHHHAPDELGARGTRVEDVAGGEDAEESADTYLARDGVRLDLGEVCPERVASVRGLLLRRLGGVGGRGEARGGQRSLVPGQPVGQGGARVVHRPAPGRRARGTAGDGAGGQRAVGDGQ